MASGIFDWDDEDDKKEVDRRPEIPPPSPFADPLPDDQRFNDQWKDPLDQPAAPAWQEPSPDDQWAREPVEYILYKPESADETIRRGGLAWSAGIVFFSSIVFMLFVGWGADYVLQSSPWGIVAGIVLGSIIGFIQFFRLSSQIFNPAKTEPAMKPLIGRDDEER